MKRTFIAHAFLLLSVLTAAVSADAEALTNPVTDPRFMILPGGKDLRTISVSGQRLSLSKGSGETFTAAKQASYLTLKNRTKTVANDSIQWVLMDLDSHQVIDRSLDSNKKFFGASTSKIFVAGTLLDHQEGGLNASQLQLMANMLVVSSNEAWTELQRQIGGGNSDRGRETIQAFTQRLGYLRTRGFQGYLGNIHGNELTADDTAEFLHDTYMNSYPGAEVLWKFMHTCRTGADRGRKYLPADVIVGAKTGTYDGDTVDPETGRAIDVAIRNHALIFNIGGHQYGLVILANTGSDEAVALLAGGLFREYTRQQR